MGCQVGKAYRLVLQENDACYSVLALLLAFVTPSRRKKGEESLRDKLRRVSSPRHWDVALVPFPADPPATAETGLACPVKWEFPPSLLILESRATKFRVLAFAEAGDTVTADHLLQMATLAAEHKPTVLGIPGHVPIPYNLECTIAMLQSLHALFQLLTTGGTLMYCPQASDFAKAMGTAARHDNGHIVSLAASLALALRSGRSTLAVAGVFGAGKTRSLTFLLAWLALTTHLKIAVVHKENPAGRAITKLLTAFELKPDHQRYFVRPVSREEAEANTACTSYDLRASEAAPYIPGCRVVIVTTGLVWDQKGQTHSTLNTHMENVDLLISEEAQQDLDLKSAFAPAVPRRAFFRLLLGDPRQSPGGVADGQRAHRTLLLKAPIGLRAPNIWYMPHEFPGVYQALLHHGRGFGHTELEEAAIAVSRRPLGSCWFRPDKVKAVSPFARQLQSKLRILIWWRTSLTRGKMWRLHVLLKKNLLIWQRSQSILSSCLEGQVSSGSTCQVVTSNPPGASMCCILTQLIQQISTPFAGLVKDVCSPKVARITRSQVRLPHHLQRILVRSSGISVMLIGVCREFL